MYVLPKVNPLYEKISSEKIIITEVLEKLGKGGFTGYLSHSSTGFESYSLFAKGKLICVVSTEDNKEKTGFEAITLLFDKIMTVGGEINVYRMTPDLVMCSHALVVGVRLFDDNEVRQVDIKGMLLRLKNQAFNGVVNFYTNEQYAMIFYLNGQPIGFYNNGSKAIETSPEKSRQVAALPGARLSVFATKPIEELMHHDLLQMVNLDKIWAAGIGRTSVAINKIIVPSPIPPTATDTETKLHDLVEDLAEVAMAYLSREGREIIEKRLTEIGGAKMLYNDMKSSAFLEMVANDAQTLDSQARTDEMIDLMKSEIAGRLAV
ncbi:MAG TPA: hypothetical protein VGJ93_09075 [Desulfuromonadaceae bacterium]|jgi:hypothetical protein